MTKPRILQIGSLSGTPGADAQLAEAYDVLAYWQADDKTACLKAAQDIDMIVTSAGVGCSADIMRALPHLKVICNWGVGYDSIDIEAATALNIKVTNTPEVLNDCVADEAMGLLIAAARRIAQGDQFVRANHWENKQNLPLGVRVSGKKLGIVGLGRIGMVIAKRASGFDMNIQYFNRNKRDDVPFKKADSLVDLARWSDFLMVATVGGSQTQALINADVMRALGPKGILINIARGPVVDEAAMVELLGSGELGGAALDVFEREPVVPDALKQMPHVVLMPHQASATHETRQAMFELVLENMQAYFAGKPLLTAVN
jgi:lactate dehydrogenase-like 2-hydroxyacid dehydrogenase